MASLAEPNPCRIRRGIVTTHPNGFSGDGPHFAITCCGRSECIRKFRAYAHDLTGLDSTYVEDRR